MFNKEDIEALFAELRRRWYRSPDWELLNRHSHLAIASCDSGRSLDDIDPRVLGLIEKYRPNR